MKTQEQQKAELCDRMMYVLRNNLVSETLMGFVSEYDQITQQKPLSQDPYIDELFSKRVLGAIYSSYRIKPKNLRLSDCPKIILLNIVRGFGRKSVEEYTEVMTKYNLTDKL